MKKFLSIFIFLIFFLLFIISVYYVNNVKNDALSVFSNPASNIDFFIKNIENIVLSVYEIDITGDRLTNSQKEFITKMYILRNRAMFQNAVKGDENPYVDVTTFNLAYTYLFGDSYIATDSSSKIDLGTLNVERFIPSSRKIVSFETEENINRVKILYTTKFENKEFNYIVSYNIGEKSGMYYLIGFTIKKNGDE